MHNRFTVMKVPLLGVISPLGEVPSLLYTTRLCITCPCNICTGQKRHICPLILGPFAPWGGTFAPVWKSTFAPVKIYKYHWQAGVRHPARRHYFGGGSEQQWWAQEGGVNGQQQGGHGEEGVHGCGHRHY